MISKTINPRIYYGIVISINICIVHNRVAAVIAVIMFARSQWNPSHLIVATITITVTIAIVISPIVAPSEKCYSRRRPRIKSKRNRNSAGAGNPAPTITGICPTAIMIRRPSPRLGRNPRPTIVVIPTPIADAIWRPAHRYTSRRPDVSIIGCVPPVTVTI